MTTTCPACERPDCSCPVCNGSGRAQVRGYSTPCLHCREVLITRLRRGLAAWEALAEWESLNPGRCIVWEHIQPGKGERPWLSGLDENETPLNVSAPTYTEAATEAARKLKLIPEEKPLQQGDD